jgi:hypothetical protein
VQTRRGESLVGDEVGVERRLAVGVLAGLDLLRLSIHVKRHAHRVSAAAAVRTAAPPTPSLGIDATAGFGVAYRGL